MSEISHTLIAPSAGRKVVISVLQQQMTSDEARALAMSIVDAANKSDAASPILLPNGPLPARA